MELLGLYHYWVFAVLLMIGLESVWPLLVTSLWWEPLVTVTMAMRVDLLMFSRAQEPLGLSKPN